MRNIWAKFTPFRKYLKYFQRYFSFPVDKEALYQWTGRNSFPSFNIRFILIASIIRKFVLLFALFKTVAETHFYDGAVAKF